MKRNNNRFPKADKTEAKQTAGRIIPKPVLSQSGERTIISQASENATIRTSRTLLYSMLKMTPVIIPTGEPSYVNGWMSSQVITSLMLSVRTRVDGRRTYTTADVTGYMNAAHNLWSLIYWLEAVDAMMNTSFYDPYITTTSALFGNASSAIAQTQSDVLDFGDTAMRFRIAADKICVLPHRVHQLLQRVYGVHLSLPREQAAAKLYFCMPALAYTLVDNGQSPGGPRTTQQLAGAVSDLTQLLTPDQQQFSVDYRAFLSDSSPMQPLNTIEFDSLTHLFFANATWRYKTGPQTPTSTFPTVPFHPGALKTYKPTLDGDDLIYAVQATNWKFGGAIWANGTYLAGVNTITPSPLTDNPFFIYNNTGLNVVNIQEGMTSMIDFMVFTYRETSAPNNVFTYQAWTKGSLVYYSTLAAGYPTFSVGVNPTIENIIDQVTMGLYFSQ